MAQFKDVVATVGTYEKDGETKFINRKIGTLIAQDDGREVIKLDASFNPAGITRRNDDGTIWLAVFEQRDSRDSGRAGSGGAGRGGRSGGAGGGRQASQTFDDDIPW